MKKMFVILGLIVLVMFVVSCAPREGAIAGQAVAKGSAVVPQNVVKFGDLVTIRTVHGSFFHTNEYRVPNAGAVAPNYINIDTFPKEKEFLINEYKAGYIVGGGPKGQPVGATSIITLQSYNQFPVNTVGTWANWKYLTAETEKGGKQNQPWSISSSADVVGPWEKFKMTYKSGQKFAYGKGISYGEKFMLKTAHGKFVSAEPLLPLMIDGVATEVLTGRVVGNRDKGGEWETFTFEKVNLN